MLRHWSQFVHNTSTDIRGHEALHHHHCVTHNVERASCGVHKLLRTLAGALRHQHLLVWWWRSVFPVFEGRAARDELFIGTRPLLPPPPPSLIDRMWSLNVKPKQTHVGKVQQFVDGGLASHPVALAAVVRQGT